MLGTIEEKIAFSGAAAAAAAAKGEAQTQQRRVLEAELEAEDAKHQSKAAQEPRGHQASTASSLFRLPRLHLLEKESIAGSLPL